ncbi:hypothetical protein EDB92DRAFT_1786504, partial [Lactarius akahatsu]
MQTGFKLRLVFITIVRDCQPSRPAHLWNLFKAHLCDDLRHFLSSQHINPLSNEMIYDYGLY